MLEELRETLDHTARIVDGAPADRYGAPTPCPEWNVRALLNHMVAANVLFGASARGEQVEPGLFTQDNLAGDASSAFRRSAEQALEAWQQPGVMEQRIFDGMPGSVAVGIYLIEQLVHGWDLARATGQDATLPQHLCEVALEAAQRLPADQMRSPRVFGPEVPVEADAPVQDRLLGFVGRTPA